MSTESMITTVDNPFDPFTDWDEWYAFDTRHGYNTSGYLARIVITSDELSDLDQEQAIERAIDEIIEMHAGGLYKKVKREVKEDSLETLES